MTSAMNQGWLCPKCGGAHAPDVKSCPQQPQPPYLPLPNMPKYPGHYTPNYPKKCSACTETGTCMCYRPNRNITTWKIEDGPHGSVPFNS